MLFEKIVYANRKIVLKVNEILKPFNLNSTDWKVIVYLTKNEYATLSKICEYYQVDKSIFSKTITKLKEVQILDFIDSSDKREKMFVLSTKGKNVFVDANVQILNFQKEITKNLDNLELATLINFIDKINLNL